MCQHHDGDQHDHNQPPRHTCCPPAPPQALADAGFTRRGFLEGLGGAALGGVALTGLTWSSLSARQTEVAPGPQRRPLVVKPIFVYRTYTRVPQRSWRSWGGVETQQNADEEIARIKGELKKLQAAADFPVKFLPLEATKDARTAADSQEAKDADALLVYACDGNFNEIAKLKKDTIFFVRHRSGPLYLYYEIISPRFLRQHTDTTTSPARRRSSGVCARCAACTTRWARRSSPSAAPEAGLSPGA